MKLAQMQQAFMANILDEGSEMPDDWSARHKAGLNIYRGNYRSALVDALRDTYAKTQIWVGEDAFRQAAINHLIAHPSASWTIDEAGADFEETCNQYFGDRGEVAELAWLEWTMLAAFSARDMTAMDLAKFGEATANFGEEQWVSMKLTMIPDLQARLVDYNLRDIWNAIPEVEETGALPPPATKLDASLGVFVWREDERSTFQMVASDEVMVWNAVQDGRNYGEICMILAEVGAEGNAEPDVETGQEAAMRAGAILGRWVQEGLVASLSV